MLMTYTQEQYLNELRDGRVVEMAKASPYLIKKFNLSPRDAHDVLTQWLSKHSPYDSPARRTEDDDSFNIINDMSSGFVLGELLSDSTPSYDPPSIDSTPDFGGGGGFDGGGASGDF